MQTSRWLAPLLAAALLAGPALATPPGGDDDRGDEAAEALGESFRKMARIRNAEALRHYENKDYPAALAAFREAFELNPLDPEVANNLAWLLEILGNHAEAEVFYRKTLELDPDRYVACVNLADLLAARESAGAAAGAWAGEANEETARLAEAADLLVKARELKGNSASVILRQARVAARRGRSEEAARFWKEYAALEPPPDEKKIEIGDFYRDSGAEDEALEWYRKVETRGEAGRQAAQRIWQIEVDREARRFGWTSRQEEIPSRARLLATRGKIHLKRGEVGEAERLLLEALELAPRYAQARMLLGDAFREWGRREKAELAYLRALSMDSRNAQIHARLGELCLEDPAGRRAAEAAVFFANALQIRPDWTVLNLRLARAHQASGDLPAALAQVNRFLADPVGDAERTEALELKASLLRLLPADVAPDRGAGHGPDGRQGADRGNPFSRARALAAMGKPEAALVELARIPDREEDVDALNLEAQILYSAGRMNEAAAVLSRSLFLLPEQGEQETLLGLVLLARSQREEALEHLLAGERAGDLSATFHLARTDLEREDRHLPEWLWDLLHPGILGRAGERLERVVQEGGDTPHHAEAALLMERLSERQRVYPAAAALAGLVLLAGLALAAGRLWGGSDLARLLREHPEAGPDVQRVLAAIRHEVLKHNTLALGAVVGALGEGAGAGELAAHLHESLFGRSQDSVPARLAEYCRELVRVGRRHQVRLNLRRDRAMKALVDGFRILEGVREQLVRVEFLPARRLARLHDRLSRAARLLNVQGYALVQELLDRLRVLCVDRTLLEGVFRRVSREPAFAGLDVAVPSVAQESDASSAGIGILVPRGAVEDILANLVRNALASSSRHAAGQPAPAIRIGLGLETLVDPVTGLERVRFWVADSSPEPLSVDAIRERRVEGGLGLAGELAGRYGGAVEVLEGSGGWAKRVAVSFPGVELED